MKYIRIILLILIPFLVVSMNTNEPIAEKVEGIFYFDQNPVRLEIENGKISKIERIKHLSNSEEKVYLAPGLIDNQVNGYKGISFVREGEKLSMEGVRTITEALWRAGVTTYMPTLRTSDQETLLKNLSLLARAKRNEELKGSIAGFHLEGPYISPVNGFRGAHALEFVQKPDWNKFAQLYEASGRNIIQVTLAPEVVGAMDFITELKKRDIVVALGHHNATTEQITEAVDRGAQISTHLGNAMANTINRHINPLWPQLSDSRLMISIIADGFHLLPEELNSFYLIKGTEKTILTSDVTRYAGLKPGKYLNTQGDTIQLTEDGAARYLARHSLSGAAAPLSQGIGKIMKATGCSLKEAIQMASSNPARLYGLSDRGHLQVGMRADIILFTLDDFKMNIKKTIVAGDVVYESTIN